MAQVLEKVAGVDFLIRYFVAVHQALILASHLPTAVLWQLFCTLFVSTTVR